MNLPSHSGVNTLGHHGVAQRLPRLASSRVWSVSKRVKRTIAIFAPCLLISCAQHQHSPRATLETLASAAARGDTTVLHSLLTLHGRRTQPNESFRRRLGAEQIELHALANAVRDALHRGDSPAVSLELSSGDALAVEDRDGWRIADTALGPGAPTTQPGRAGVQAAIDSLHRALARRDLIGILSLLSARARGGIIADLRALAEATESVLATAQTTASDATSIRLSDGRFLHLVREDGAWRVDSVTDTP